MRRVAVGRHVARCVPSTPAHLAVNLRRASAQLAAVLDAGDAHNLRHVPINHFPLLVLCSAGSRPRVLDIVRGSTWHGDALKAIDRALNAERREVRMRRERDECRRQQDADYERALAEDAAVERGQLEAMHAEQRDAQTQAALVARRRQLMDELPAEPDASDASATTLRLRLPDGRAVDRRFGARDRLADVFALAGAHGCSHETHRLLTSDYPTKRDVSGSR